MSETLGEQLQRARTYLFATYSRERAKSIPGMSYLVKMFPLGWGEASAVADELNERFKSWTGVTLEQHFQTRQRHPR